MLGVRVRALDAQRVKRELKESGALDTSKKARREGEFVVFPVLQEVEGFESIETEFDEFEGHKKFRDVLREKLTEEETALAKRAFDVIGDIAIIEVPQELEKHESTIAKALMGAHNNIRSVYKKSGDISGEERVRELKFLAGEDKTETIYKEHGMNLKLDVSTVYFSPRLSAERERILAQTKSGEVVVDLFAGIGPFAILLAKNRDIKVHAIDVNESAFEYLKENIRINKVADKVTPLLGDCREAAPKGEATRVIMNLPKSSSEFLDTAFDVIKEGVINYYAISREEDLYDSKIDFIEKIAKEKGRIIKIMNKKIVRPYAPYTYHIVIDIGVK
ncbi:class I SAM-dependent methyltransferase family protein [archaeon]|nr:class I SAM-dependent methyltransferase family protein [archaeon]